jgi:hypothetical protein
MLKGFQQKLDYFKFGFFWGKEFIIRLRKLDTTKISSTSTTNMQHTKLLDSALEQNNKEYLLFISRIVYNSFVPWYNCIN